MRVRALGLLMFFPGEKPESTHVECPSFHTHSPVTSTQTPELGLSNRDVEMTESQCLALGIKQGHSLKY